MRLYSAALTLILATTAHAAPKTAAPATDIATPARAAKPPATTGPAQATGPGDRALWDYWYTVTVNKVVHYEYYNDHAEIKKGRIVFQNHAWKQEEDFINEEQLGVFAVNNAEITPLFYNFHSTYRSVETSIDGNVRDGKEMTVRVRKADTELPLIKRAVPAKAFFSEFLPLWLGRHMAGFSKGEVYPFLAILEDNLESAFNAINGQIRIDPPDELATKTRTTRVLVNFNEQRSVWYVDAAGAPVRIEMPLQKTVVERVPADKAKSFLDES